MSVFHLFAFARLLQDPVRVPAPRLPAGAADLMWALGSGSAFVFGVGSTLDPEAWRGLSIAVTGLITAAFGIWMRYGDTGRTVQRLTAENARQAATLVEQATQIESLRRAQVDSFRIAAEAAASRAAEQERFLRDYLKGPSLTPDAGTAHP